MSETLFEIQGFRVTITLVYSLISVIVLFLFMSLWLIGRKKRTGNSVFAGQVMNGIGFGLLPALGVLKAFQEAGTGKGLKVMEHLPLIKWLSVDGYYMPGRIEAAAAMVCFVLLCLWLIIRKRELPDNGDLIMISVCIWASIRLITEDFRTNQLHLFRFASCGAVLLCAAVWTFRRSKLIRTPVRTAIDLAAICVCIGANLATATHLATVGSEIGDYAVKCGSAALMLALTLMIGGDVRSMTEKQAPAEQAPADMGDTQVVQKV